MSKNVFVFAESRSGSNWLVETLHNHPSIDMLKEIFQDGQRNRYIREKKLEFECYKRGNDVRYLEMRLEDLKKEWGGCKILFQEIRLFDFYDFLEHYQDARFIILQRGNSVRAEVSSCIARTYGRGVQCISGSSSKVRWSK